MTKEKDELIIFQEKNGAIEFRGDFDNENVIWGSLNQIADLFNRDKSVISRHIKNIFKTGELDSDSTVAKIATVQNEGGREVVRDIEYFNLDVILSVGYRVDSQQATQFRIWATKHINNLLKDGEIEEKSNVQILHVANSDKPVKFYSLDVILAVGYKTNSSRAIIFRQALKNHIVKGFTINEKRISKNHQEFLQAVDDMKLLLKCYKNISLKLISVI